MTDIRHPLMIHVERIVRPICATERLKLSMRRELLAHLTAAFEEECRAGSSENDAVDKALARLGSPAELSRSLQASVPLLQRLFLARIPISGRLERCEKTMSRQMGMARMPLGQQALFTFGAAIPTYCTLILLGILLNNRHHQQLLQATTEHSLRFFLGTVLGTIQLLCIQGSAFAILGATYGQKGKSPAWYGLWLFVFILLWQIETLVFLARVAPTPFELLCGALAAIALFPVLAWVGRLTLRVGRRYREWLDLDIA